MKIIVADDDGEVIASYDDHELGDALIGVYEAIAEFECIGPTFDLITAHVKRLET